GPPRGRGAGAARLAADRRPQPVDGLAVLGALADRPDAGMAGPQLVVDHDAPPDLEPRRAGEAHVGPHAGRDDDEAGVELLPAGEPHALGAAVAGDLLGAPVEQHVGAGLADAPLEQ